MYSIHSPGFFLQQKTETVLAESVLLEVIPNGYLPSKPEKNQQSRKRTSIPGVLPGSFLRRRLLTSSVYLVESFPDYTKS